MQKDRHSMLITDINIITSFVANPRNVFLVSFPRTGSHWLRMLMEKYFERPILRRIFYYPYKTNFLALHSHDMELILVRENVIYLYRNPIDVVFSEMIFLREDIGDLERVLYWTNAYATHLNKWLVQEQFTKKKTIVQYEGLLNNPLEEFSKVCAHFGEDIDKDKFLKVYEFVTKDEVLRKNLHDSRIVRIESEYEKTRADFRERWRTAIWEVFLSNRDLSHFLDYFEPWMVA